MLLRLEESPAAFRCHTSDNTDLLFSQVLVAVEPRWQCQLWRV